MPEAAMRHIPLLCGAMLAFGSAPAIAQNSPATLLNAAGLITDADYPAGARRTNQQGRVIVRFDVTETGAVANCRLVQSSSWAVLDATTCALFERRARYAPATSSGVTVASTQTKSISWRLPGQPPAELSDKPASPDQLLAFANIKREMAATATVKLRLGRGGGVHGCELTNPSGYEPIDSRLCDLLKEHGMVFGRMNTEGDPVPATRVAHIDWSQWERLRVMKPSIGFDHLDTLAIHAD